MVTAGEIGSARPVSGADRFHQSAYTQNAHHPFHVVGQNVQRHFRADVLERFHLEVCRSHPRLYRAEGMLDRLTADAHLIRISIEACLHSLKDGFVLPARYPPLLASCALALQCAALASVGPVTPQRLAILFV